MQRFVRITQLITPLVQQRVVKAVHKKPSIDQSYVFGVHASAIPGGIDVGDIPLPPGGKKKLNIKYSSNNPPG